MFKLLIPGLAFPREGCKTGKIHINKVRTCAERKVKIIWYVSAG